MARKRNKSTDKGAPRRSSTRSRQPAATPGDAVAGRAAAAAVDLLNQGKIPAAVSVIEQGLRAAPQHADLLHLAGQVTLMRGDQAQGRQRVEQAVRSAPDVALFRLTLGNVYMVDGELERALEQYRRALRIEPKRADAYTNIGIALARLDRINEAEAAFADAADLDPANLEVQLNLAKCNMELRRTQPVVEALARVEELAGDPPADLLHEIGNIYRHLGESDAALSYYRRSLERDAEVAGVWFALGDVLSHIGHQEEADKALAEAAARGYPIAPLRLAQARVAARRGAIDSAAALLAEARDGAGMDVTLLVKIAHQYTLIGDFGAQASCLQRCLELDPGNMSAFAGLAFAPGRTLSDSDTGRLRRFVDDRTADPDTRSLVGFALGNHFQHLGRFDDAFACYRLGNRLKGYHFDRSGYANWVSDIERRFDTAFFAQRRTWGSDATLPLLIVGLPRSGTTLLEQVLSAHDGVHGAGELGTVAALSRIDGSPEPDFRQAPELADTLDAPTVSAHAQVYLGTLRGLARQGESFVSNKLPHNFEHLGLFGLMFPQAPVIHITREPRDNLLSIYLQNFSSFHNYAYDLGTLAEYYRLHRRLMAHWLSVIPNPVFSLSYEELIDDLPGKSRQLADFLGLPWQASMLRFHEQERLVQTASKWQVRQQLYATSVGRWRPYARHLGPLLKGLDAMDSG